MRFIAFVVCVTSHTNLVIASEQKNLGLLQESGPLVVNPFSNKIVAFHGRTLIVEGGAPSWPQFSIGDFLHT